MFNRSNAWNSYKKVATQTASKGQLVLMLLDGAIRFLEKARLGFHEKDLAQFNQIINNNVVRAQAVITELNSSLNMAEGGEFAQNMRRLYNYFEWRLQQANLQKDCAPIEEVLGRISVLRNAWAEMLRSESQPASKEVRELAAA